MEVAEAPADVLQPAAAKVRRAVEHHRHRRRPRAQHLTCHVWGGNAIACHIEIGCVVRVQSHPKAGKLVSNSVYAQHSGVPAPALLAK